MSTITKIKPIDLKKLNNAEHLNHMSRFRALVPVEEEGDRPEIINLLSSTPPTHWASPANNWLLSTPSASGQPTL